MLPMVIVATPTVPPHKCFRCPAVHDLLDTRVDVLGLGIPASDMLGRLYICRDCSKAISREWGFAPGKNLDRLATADAQLAEHERAVENANARVVAVEARENEYKREIADLTDILASMQAREDQLRRALSDEAQAKLAVLDA